MKKFPELRYRQIHLDFHTSELIDNIGADFNEKEFIANLKTGHVNSVTAFAVCHHGWSYYPTKVGEVHPHLKTMLLPRMLTAARDADIDMPVYITVGWNERIARLHPEWVVRNRDGKLMDLYFENGQRKMWHRICLNTPYLDHLIEVTREIMELYNPIGLFFDIIRESPCYCENCLKTLREKNIDINDENALKELGTSILLHAMDKITREIYKYNPECRAYFNGHDRKGRNDLYPYYSHYEIESLPTTDWCGGYQHFPQNAHYFLWKQFDFLGQTGKFHTTWGEFGGFKSVQALQYETMRIIMHGAKCSIGDQMHPSGKLEPATYQLIGEAYHLVETKEEYCRGAKSVAEIAIVAPTSITHNQDFEDAEIGAAMMLTETMHLFDMVDDTVDFNKYQVVILPDEVPIDVETGHRLAQFIRNGGKVIASGNSLDNLDCGVVRDGVSPHYIDYTFAKPLVTNGMVSSNFFNYIPAVKTKLVDGEVLAEVKAPYFNRTEQEFCSHVNTPCSHQDAGYPGIVRKGNVIYFAHKIFTMYRNKGMKLHRDLAINCLDLLYEKPLLHAKFPSAGTIMLLKQPQRHILHLLYAIPIKRGDIEVIEDIVPVRDVEIKLRIPAVRGVKLVPEQKDLEFHYDGDYCTFTVPEVNLHQMVELS